MKRVLSLIMVLAMVLAMVPAVFAADATVVSSGTAQADADSKFTYMYSPAVDGTLTVTVGDGNTAWASDIMDFSDFSDTDDVTGTAEGSYTHPVVAGVTYYVRIFGQGEPSAAISNVPYTITFEANETVDLGEAVVSGTASCYEQTFTGEGETWTEYLPEEVTVTAPADGTFVVKLSAPTGVVSAKEPAWSCEAIGTKVPDRQTTDGTYRFDAYSGIEYTIAIGAYDLYEDESTVPKYIAGDVAYEIYFVAGEVEKKDYVVSGHVPMDVEVDDAMILWYKDAGENREYTPASVFSGESVVNVSEDYAVEVDPTAVTTIFAFEPAMDANGVYKFTAPEGVTLTYWGTQSALPALQEKDSALADNVIYATVDNGIWNLCKPVINTMGDTSEDPNDWYWLWSSSQMLIGVAGASGDVVLTVEKTEALESLEADVSGEDTPNYENVHTFPAGFNNLSADATVEFVDVTEAHTAVLGEDGYYHLDTADGAILYVDTETAYCSLSTLLQGMHMNTTYVNDEGEEVKENMQSAMGAYVSAADANGVYPLTKDLVIFLQNYGWQDVSNMPYDEETVNKDTKWMALCCYEVAGADVQENVLVIGQNEIAVPAEGVTYTYTAEEAGNLNIRVAECDMPSYAMTVSVNGEEVAYVEDGEVDGTLPAAVEVDDVVTVSIETYDSNFAAAAGNATLNVVYVAEAVEASATITFDSTAKRTVYTTEQQVWVENGITVTNNKSASTTNVADYSKPARFYKNSELIIACAGNITQIVVDCNSSDYATALQNSIDTATASVTVSSDKVTIVPVAAADSYTIATLSGGQVRVDGMTVSYKAAACAHDNIENVAAEAATCTEIGYTAGVYCNDCELYIYGHDMVAASGHSYVVGDVITCKNCDLEEAITSLADAATISAEAGSKYTAEKYFVKGEITSVVNTTYGNVYIEDEDGNELYIYGIYSVDGSVRYDAMEVQPAVGDTVVLTGVLGTYTNSNTNVTTNQMKNAWLVEHTVYVPCEHTATTPVDNEDGATHNLVCNECEEVAEANVPHNYVDGSCACGAEDPAEEPTLPTGDILVESYGTGWWIAPATGTVTLTNAGSEVFVVYNGNVAVVGEPTTTATIEVEEGVEYGIIDAGNGVNFTVNYAYTSVSEGGETEPTYEALPVNTVINVGQTSFGAVGEELYYVYTAEAAGTLELTLSNAIMGGSASATVTYNEAEQALTPGAEAPLSLTLTAGESVYVVVNCNTYASLTTAWNGEGEGGDDEEVTTLSLGENNVETASGLAGGSWIYTPAEDGTLTVTVTALSYSEDEGATWTEVPAEYLANQFMMGNYTLAIDGVTASDTGSADVTANTPVTITLSSRTGTPVKATIVLAQTAGGEGGDVEEDGSADAPWTITELPWSWTVEGSHDAYFKYTPAEDCTLIITRPAGGYVSGLTNYEQDDNGNYIVSATAGETITLNPWGNNAGTYTMAVQEEEVEADGSQLAPYIIEALPYEAEVVFNENNLGEYGDYNVYYRYTAKDAISVQVDYCEGVTFFDVNYREFVEDANGNRIYTLAAGDVLELNAFGYTAGTYSIKVSEWVKGDPDGSELNPYILDTVPTTFTATIDGGAVYYEYTATAAGAIAAECDAQVGIMINGNYAYGDPITYAAGDVLTFAVGGYWDSGEYEVKLYDPTVAMIGEARYTDLSDALEAAQAGETVTLVVDTEEDYVIIKPDVTLDLGANTLTANYVIGLQGGYLTAQTVDADGNGGKLIVAQENISLSEAAPVSADNATANVIPVWNEDHYIFTMARIRASGDGLVISEDGNTVELNFATTFSGYVRNLLHANGSAAHDLSIIVTAKWENAALGANLRQEFVFNDDMVKAVSANSNNSYYATLGGCNSKSDLVLQLMIVTDCGVVVYSAEYPVNVAE